MVKGHADQTGWAAVQKGGFSALIGGARMDGRVLTADVALRGRRFACFPAETAGINIGWLLLPGRAMDVLLLLIFQGRADGAERDCKMV